MAVINLHRGDDTSSFGGGLFKIAYSGTARPISKMEISLGAITRVYESPVFPIQINLTSYESNLNKVGKYSISLFIYDSDGKKLTIPVDSTLNIVDIGTVFPVPYENQTLIDLATVIPAPEEEPEEDPEQEPENPPEGNPEGNGEQEPPEENPETI